MRRLVCFAIGGAALLAAEGWTQASVPTVHEAMKDVVAPQAQLLWDVSNGALDDDGNPDAKRLKQTDWDKIAEAGQRMHEMATALAMADRIVAVVPGVKIESEGNEGGSTGAQVQGFIDADRKAFAEHARALAEAADSFVAAAKAKDAAKLGEVSGALDQVCEACHLKYWYPNEAGAGG